MDPKACYFCTLLFLCACRVAGLWVWRFVGLFFWYVVKEHAPFNPFNDQVARYMVIFIQGVCSLAECRSFVSKCSPVGTDLPPSARDHFQHHDLVNVSTHGFQTPSGNRVDILHYFGEVFAQREFTDAYTFHVSKHCITSTPQIPIWRAELRQRHYPKMVD